MLDRQARAALQPALVALARPLHRLGCTPNVVTGVGFLIGVGACVAAAMTAWNAALGLWLLNRLVDGVDGPLARLRREAGDGADDGVDEGLLGGYLDVVADFAIYGGFVAGCGIGQAAARPACLVLLVTYYVNGAAFLAFSSVAEQLRRRHPDERSLYFVGGLTEGGETVLAHALMALIPSAIPAIAWVFAGAVGVTVVQRVVHARRTVDRAGG